MGGIATRLIAEAREATDPFDELRRIGIDEIRRWHKYLIVVVDDDTCPTRERRPEEDTDVRRDDVVIETLGSLARCTKADHGWDGFGERW